MRYPIALAGAAALTLAACGQDSAAGNAANGAAPGTAATTAPEGKIADALGKSDDKRFAEALKSAGLQQVLAGPGPYTVLVPGDAAFAKLSPATAADSRERTTRLLTGHILPGTMLAADIGRAIDTGKGKAVLATMGGGTLTATREGDALVLTDAGGGKVRVVGAERNFANGVVHRIDGVLQPRAG